MTITTAPTNGSSHSAVSQGTLFMSVAPPRASLRIVAGGDHAPLLLVASLRIVAGAGYVHSCTARIATATNAAPTNIDNA